MDIDAIKEAHLILFQKDKNKNFKKEQKRKVLSCNLAFIIVFSFNKAWAVPTFRSSLSGSCRAYPAR